MTKRYSHTGSLFELGVSMSRAKIWSSHTASSLGARPASHVAGLRGEGPLISRAPSKPSEGPSKGGQAHPWSRWAGVLFALSRPAARPPRRRPPGGTPQLQAAGRGAAVCRPTPKAELAHSPSRQRDLARRLAARHDASRRPARSSSLLHARPRPRVNNRAVVAVRTGAYEVGTPRTCPASPRSTWTRPAMGRPASSQFSPRRGRVPSASLGARRLSPRGGEAR